MSNSIEFLIRSSLTVFLKDKETVKKFYDEYANQLKNQLPKSEINNEIIQL